MSTSNPTLFPKENSLNMFWLKLFIRRGTAKCQLGDFSGACEDYEKAVAIDGENEELKAEQQRLLRIINNQADLITAVAQQANRVEESVRLYELAYSGRLDEMATSHLNLETAFRGERVRLDASTARVRDLIDCVARDQTRIEQESTRTGRMWQRLEELEAGTNRSGYATHLSGYAKLRIDKLEAALKREREDGADTSE